jgi:hypothetical protein
MNYVEYERTLEDRLRAYFDIEKNAEIDSLRFPLIATHSSRHAQTVLGRHNVVDYAETHETFLVSSHERIDIETLQRELTAVVELIPSISRPSRTHKSTTITRVLVIDRSSAIPTEEAALNAVISRFRKSRAHFLYLHGWTTVRAAVVFLDSGTIHPSPAARELIATLRPNAAKTAV